MDDPPDCELPSYATRRRTISLTPQWAKSLFSSVDGVEGNQTALENSQQKQNSQRHHNVKD
jgi:hypothetical protein